MPRVHQLRAVGEKLSLQDLLEASGNSTSPAIVPPLPLQPGGVDPLGMRQLNFDLMDRALPGLNNVANRIRPYVAVTWAWWKATNLARARGGAKVDLRDLKGYVDRFEVVFAASHLQAGEFAGLLGSQVLTQYLSAGGSYIFTGPTWHVFQKNRAMTTSLMAPVAYGPSIKVGYGLGYLDPREEGAFAPTPAVMPAIEAFDARMSPILGHPVFASLDETDVSASEVGSWLPHWRITDLTPIEREVGRQRLYDGNDRGGGRRPLLELIEKVLQASPAPLDVAGVRTSLGVRILDDPSSSSAERPEKIWRALQARQLLRLALEGLLVWVLDEITSRSLSLEDLSRRLAQTAGIEPKSRFGIWLDDLPDIKGGPAPGHDPVTYLERIRMNGRREDWPAGLLTGLKISLAGGAEAQPQDPLYAGHQQRLPLGLAVARVNGMLDFTVEEALETILAEWVIGQHVYWAVSRSGDQTQRLRLMLDEGGWTAILTQPSLPNPTPDRLETALNLMADCGVVTKGEDNRFHI